MGHGWINVGIVCECVVADWGVDQGVFPGKVDDYFRRDVMWWCGVMERDKTGIERKIYTCTACVDAMCA
jgi:hypothetical protein